ncbi:MAG TPA: TonB-dependent receptor [Pyrinomonadaceae bacterium]|nr:TonB-dependent receptor [Pyrinomonadaceae bacterium]
MKRLSFQEHNPGFTFGGPLRIPGTGLGTSTAFFSSYEFTTVLDSTLIDTLVPVQQNALYALPPPTTLEGRRFEIVDEPALAAEIAPFRVTLNTPSRNHRFTSRVDHRFSDTHNGALVYQMGRLANLRRSGGANRLIEALQSNYRQSDSISYSDTLVLSSTLVNQTRFQAARLLPALKARGGSAPVVLIALNDPLDVGDTERRTGTVIGGSSTTGSTARSESRFQIQNVLDYQRDSHSVRLGFDIQRVRSTFIDLADASGTFNFASAGDFLAGIPNRFRQNFLTQSTQRNTYFGLFFQDEWQARQNLKLSFGLRYERETILRDRNNFAPRFSVAYDPLKSGRTVVRFGVGLFYNRVLLRTIDDFTLGAQRLFFDTNLLRDPATDRLLTVDQRRAFIAANLTFPTTLTSASPLVQEHGVLNTGFSRRLEPGLRIPESYQTNIGFERHLGHRLILEANYTFNRGIHLWREFNVNAPVLPPGFKDFSEYLASRDFPNLRRGPTGLRPLYNAANAGELVRFTLHSGDPNPNAIARVVEFGVPVSLINLNSFSSTAVQIALATLNDLRRDPTHGEIEQLIAAGNSFYRGPTVELRKTFRGSDLNFSFRAAYTVAHLVDDGIVNTSDALRPGDFRGERARSLLDRRHRFVFSGTFEMPRYLGRFRLSPVLRWTSGAPFNISIGGVDRNLDDVSNDRPGFTGDPKLLIWRRPDQEPDPALLDLFHLPTIGQSGNLPRNAGQGPGQFIFDLNLTREFHLRENLRLRPVIEFDNILNKTVFSFGTEFINFNALGPLATPEQRQALLDSFLVTTRTLRPRQLRIGVRLDF